MRFRVGFDELRVPGSGFRVFVLALGFREFVVYDSGVMFQGLGITVSGLRFGVQV